MSRPPRRIISLGDGEGDSDGDGEWLEEAMRLLNGNCMCTDEENMAGMAA